MPRPSSARGDTTDDERRAAQATATALAADAARADAVRTSATALRAACASLHNQLSPTDMVEFQALSTEHDRAWFSIVAPFTPDELVVALGARLHVVAAPRRMAREDTSARALATAVQSAHELVAAVGTSITAHTPSLAPSLGTADGAPPADVTTLAAPSASSASSSSSTTTTSASASSSATAAADAGTLSTSSPPSTRPPTPPPTSSTPALTARDEPPRTTTTKATTPLGGAPNAGPPPTAPAAAPLALFRAEPAPAQDPSALYSAADSWGSYAPTRGTLALLATLRPPPTTMSPEAAHAFNSHMKAHAQLGQSSKANLQRLQTALKNMLQPSKRSEALVHARFGSAAPAIVGHPLLPRPSAPWTCTDAHAAVALVLEPILRELPVGKARTDLDTRWAEASNRLGATPAELYAVPTSDPLNLDCILGDALGTALGLCRPQVHQPWSLLAVDRALLLPALRYLQSWIAKDVVRLLYPDVDPSIDVATSLVQARAELRTLVGHLQHTPEDVASAVGNDALTLPRFIAALEALQLPAFTRAFDEFLTSQRGAPAATAVVKVIAPAPATPAPPMDTGSPTPPLPRHPRDARTPKSDRHLSRCPRPQICPGWSGSQANYRCLACEDDACTAPADARVASRAADSTYVAPTCGHMPAAALPGLQALNAAIRSRPRKQVSKVSEDSSSSSYPAYDPSRPGGDPAGPARAAVPADTTRKPVIREPPTLPRPAGPARAAAWATVELAPRLLREVGAEHLPQAMRQADVACAHGADADAFVARFVMHPRRQCTLCTGRALLLLLDLDTPALRERFPKFGAGAAVYVDTHLCSSCCWSPAVNAELVASDSPPDPPSPPLDVTALRAAPEGVRAALRAQTPPSPPLPSPSTTQMPTPAPTPTPSPTPPPPAAASGIIATVATVPSLAARSHLAETGLPTAVVSLRDPKTRLEFVVPTFADTGSAASLISDVTVGARHLSLRPLPDNAPALRDLNGNGVMSFGCTLLHIKDAAGTYKPVSLYVVPHALTGSTGILLGRTALGRDPFHLDVFDSRTAPLADTCGALGDVPITTLDAEGHEWTEHTVTSHLGNGLSICVTLAHVDSPQVRAIFGSPATPVPIKVPDTTYEPATSMNFPARATEPDAWRQVVRSGIDPALPLFARIMCSMMVERYWSIFGGASQLPLGPARHVITTIQLRQNVDEDSIFDRARPLGPLEAAAVQEFVAPLLAAGYLRPSFSPCQAVPVVVPKVDSSGKQVGWRIAVDFRKLNAATVPDRGPLPRVEELVRRLARSPLKTCFDATAQFWQVPLDDAAIHLTATNFAGVLLEWTVMPMGLINASALAQRWFDVICDLDHFFAYIDDLFIASADPLSLVADVEHMLYRLYCAGVTVSAKKARIGWRTVSALGYEIGFNSIRPLPARVNALCNLPTPRDKKELRYILQATQHYQRFIPKFALTVLPLRQLLSNNKRTIADMTPADYEALDALRVGLANAQTLRPFEPLFGPVRVETDWSELGMSWSVSQYDLATADWHLLTCNARACTPAESHYGAADGELAAMRACARENWDILRAAPFTWVTDSEANQKASTGGNDGRYKERRIHTWQELAPLSFQVVHSKGKDLPHVDALSRLAPALAAGAAHPPLLAQVGLVAVVSLPDLPEVPVATADADAPTTPTPLPDTDKVWPPLTDALVLAAVAHARGAHAPTDPRSGSAAGLRDQMELLRADPFALSLARAAAGRTGRPLTLSPDEAALVDTAAPYLVHGLLYAHGRRYIPPALRPEWLRSVHESSCGHRGAPAMIASSSSVWWPGIDAACRELAAACPTCQATRVHRDTSTMGRGTPTQQPTMVWQLDLMQLPLADDGARHALVAVCESSRFTVTEPLDDKEAATIARAFLRSVYRIFDAPSLIRMDPGSEFKGVMADVCARLGIVLAPSLPRDHDATGLVERTIGLLKRSLAATLSAADPAAGANFDTDDWPLRLLEATLAHNRTAGSDLPSPYLTMFGREPNTPLYNLFELGFPSTPSDASAVALDQTRATRKRRHDAAAAHRGGHDTLFEAGDLVLLHAPLAPTKLQRQHRNAGPFRVVSVSQRDGEHGRRVTLAHLDGTHLQPNAEFAAGDVFRWIAPQDPSVQEAIDLEPDALSVAPLLRHHDAHSVGATHNSDDDDFTDDEDIASADEELVNPGSKRPLNRRARRARAKQQRQAEKRRVLEAAEIANFKQLSRLNDARNEVERAAAAAQLDAGSRQRRPTDFLRM